MVERHPDRDYTADEDLLDGVYGEFDENDARLKELEEANKNYAATEGKLTKMFGDNPVTADLLISMAEEGKDPVVALVGMYGKEGIEAILNDPEKAEAMAEANKKFHESVAKSKELEDEREKNLVESFAMEDALLESGEMSEEDLVRAHESLETKYNNMLMGKWTKEDLFSELRSLNHDADVQTARQEGEVAGRNANIVARKRKESKSDGMPSLGGGGGKGVRKADTSKLGALGRERRSMWD